MLFVKDFEKLLRFFIKRKVYLQKYYLDDPQIQYKLNFDSYQKSKFFFETLTKILK